MWAKISAFITLIAGFVCMLLAILLPSLTTPEVELNDRAYLEGYTILESQTQGDSYVAIVGNKEGVYRYYGRTHKFELLRLPQATYTQALQLDLTLPSYEVNVDSIAFDDVCAMAGEDAEFRYGYTYEAGLGVSAQYINTLIESYGWELLGVHSTQSAVEICLTNDEQSYLRVIATKEKLKIIPDCGEDVTANWDYLSSVA